MIIGCLGDVPFEVSAKTVRTLSNFVWSGSASYANHKRAAGNSLTEFTGLEPDKITFDIVISAYLGVNPMEEITKIWDMEREGRVVALVIGHHGYGRDKWTVTDHKTKVTATDGEGDITHATVSVTLQEYLRE